MSKAIRPWAVVLAVWLPTLALAQPLLTLDEAIALGLQNNYSLTLSRYQAEAAAAKRVGGQGQFLPSASASLSNSGKVDGGTPKTEVGASLEWQVFDGFQTYHAYRQLRSQEQSAVLEERSSFEGTTESVILAYYDIVQQKQRMASIRELLAVSEERSKLANAKLEIGAGSRLEQLQAVADLNEDSSNFLNQEVSLRDSKIKLNQLLARDPGLDFQVADSIPLAGAQPVEEWRKILLENNSSVAAARARRDAAVSGLGEARGQWLPNLTTGLGYSTSPEALNSAAVSQPHGWAYNVKLSMPLFDKLATPTGIRRAKLELRQAETEVKQAESDAVAQFEQARSLYESGLRRTALEERNLQVARLQAEGAQERYRVGASSSLEFRDAQTRLLDAEVRLITARQSVKQAETALQRLSGQLIRPTSMNTEGK